MKNIIKYLSVFVAVVILVSGCEKEKPAPPTQDPVHRVVFSGMDILPEVNVATVIVPKADYTIDGEIVEEFSQGIEFGLKGSSDWTRVEFSSYQDEVYHYSINNLAEETEYQLRQWCQTLEGETVNSEAEYFMTEKGQISQDDYSVEVSLGEIIPYGVYARIELLSVEYFINDISADIARLYLEYAPSGANNYDSIEISDWDYISQIIVELPPHSDEYLQENTTYGFRFKVIPSEESAPELTSSQYTLTTTDAEIYADIPSPVVENIPSEGISVAGEGIVVDKDHRLPVADYLLYIDYSVEGTSQWSSIPASATSGGYSVVIPAERLLPETLYRIRTKVVVSDSEFFSESVSLETPKEDNPEQPPVGGDTSQIEGTWKLIQWKGTEPDFEVYMEISSIGEVVLWQKIDNRGWEQYISAAYLENGIVSGVYSDGIPWGASYYYSLVGDTMTWTVVDDSTDVSVYQKSTLPSELQSIRRSMQQSEITERFL